MRKCDVIYMLFLALIAALIGTCAFFSFNGLSYLLSVLSQQEELESMAILQASLTGGLKTSTIIIGGVLTKSFHLILKEYLAQLQNFREELSRLKNGYEEKSM